MNNWILMNFLAIFLRSEYYMDASHDRALVAGTTEILFEPQTIPYILRTSLELPFVIVSRKNHCCKKTKLYVCTFSGLNAGTEQTTFRSAFSRLTSWSICTSIWRLYICDFKEIFSNVDLGDFTTTEINEIERTPATRGFIVFARWSQLMKTLRMFSNMSIKHEIY